MLLMSKHFLVLLVTGVVIISTALALLVYRTAEAPYDIDSKTDETSLATTTEQSNDVATSSLQAGDVTSTVVSNPKPAKPVVLPNSSVNEEKFTGKISEVNVGCFADGECYAVVGGKHVTLTVGRKQEVLGSIVGADSIGDLEQYIGETATVYAAVNKDGTYTLYGDSAYYLSVTPKIAKGCVVGGCSSQLCVEEGRDVVSTCEWSEKYSCYQKAKCERQSSGQCGWTETKELLMCIEQASTN